MASTEQDRYRQKQRKEMSDDPFESENDMEEASDPEMDEELRLPEELNGISQRDRKELYKFKQQHTEIEYENEVMRRIDLLQPQKDLERLKMMTEGTTKEAVSVKKTPKKSKAKPDPVAKKTRLNVVKDDDEDDEGVVENTTRGGQSEDDGDQSSSDDLFGEDEINEIAAESRHQNRQSLEEEPTEVKSRLRKGTRAQTTEVAAKKRSALDLYEEEEYNEDGEEDGESGDEGEVKVKKTSKPSSSADDVFPGGEVDTSELADLTDYQRIQTRRMFIDKWISEPFFDGVVIGSFVRLFVGLQESVQIYRMCEVTDVVPYKRPYRLPGTEITVDRALLVKLGSSEKVAKMYHVSNSRISEKEFQFYVNTMKACREEDKLLRKNTIDQRRKKIYDTLHHTYTNEEIQSMVEKNSAKNKALTTNNANALKNLENKLAIARSEEDFDEMEKLQKDIEKINREINLSKELYSKNYGNLTDLNKRNKSLNVQLDMQAAERRRQQEHEQTLRGDAKNLVDPFARRETRPQILWVTGKKKNKDEAAEAEKGAKDAGPIASKEDEYLVSTDLDINPEQIGKRIYHRYGFDPYAASLFSKKERYLQLSCGDLPPIGSVARESIRVGLSLAKYRETMCEVEES